MIRNRVQNGSNPAGTDGPAASGSGFTLFEMLIVLVIMSLTAAFVVPQLAGSLTRMNARSAAGKISAALRYARSQAVAERIPYLSDFDLRANRLTVKQYQPEKEESTAETGVVQSEYDLPDGVRLEVDPAYTRQKAGTDSYAILFYPTGGSSGGEIRVRDESERTWTVTVDLVTGAVRLQE